LRRAYKEPAICKSCGLVYHEKKWVRDESLRKKLEKEGGVHYVICPACRKENQHYPMGIVELTGNFWYSHQNDILNLIKNEEKRAIGKNPLERIMEIKEKKDMLSIETTRESLAKRIGKVLEKAYKGKLRYTFSGGEKMIRIEWHRDE